MASEVMEATMAVLRRSPKIEFLDLRDKLRAKKLDVYPITFGRAKALMGLVPMAKRGTGPRAQAKAKEAGEAVPRRRTVKDAVQASSARRERVAKTPVASNGALAADVAERLQALIETRDRINIQIDRVEEILAEVSAS